MIRAALPDAQIFWDEHTKKQQDYQVIQTNEKVPLGAIWEEVINHS